MHTANFKTFVNTGEKEPQELSIEYIPGSDLIVFSLGDKEVFNMTYTDNLEPIVGGITTIRGIQGSNNHENV